jgi:O-antigen/teichoic acid export membrane protein
VLFGAATQLQARLDLFVLAALDAARPDVGVYGAVQHLAVAPGLLSLALAPLTFSSLAGYRRDGLHDHAKRFGSIALRASLCLIPFIGLVAGTSEEFLRICLGKPYAEAEYVFPLLFAASVCIAVATVCVSIAAADNKQPALVPIGFLVAVLSLAALLYVVPRWGTFGAALVTFLASLILVFACYALIDQDWRTASGQTFGRALLVTPFVYLTTSVLSLESPTSLALVLIGGTLFIAAALYGLGELQRSERTALSAMLTQSWRHRPRRFLRRKP